MTKQFAATIAAGLLTAATLAAQGKPDFSGTWVMDTAKTAALNGGRTGGMAPAGAMSGGGQAGGAGGGNTMTPVGAPSAPTEIKIVQTPATLTIERNTPAGPQKFVHKLDGTESVNVNGRATLKTKSQWQGAALVTEGTNVVNGEDGAITVTLKETRALDADGNLTVTVARTIDGTTTTSRQVFAKKKM